ncbi:MAG: hypothetical protein IIZ18_05755 [Ruminococcus sp.]|nr:hypothetical protein [Ruminococcus sp.]
MEELNISAYCDGAFKFVEQFGKKFTNSPKDADTMEYILGKVANRYQSGRLSDADAQKIAYSLGVYLGQLILENGGGKGGYRWAMHEGVPCLEKNAGWKMFPVTKVFKRIKGNVSDSVSAFYKTSIMIAEGKIKKN